MWCFPLHEKYIRTTNQNDYGIKDYVHIIFKVVFEAYVEERLCLWLWEHVPAARYTQDDFCPSVSGFPQQSAAVVLRKISQNMISCDTFLISWLLFYIVALVVGLQCTGDWCPWMTQRGGRCSGELFPMLFLQKPSGVSILCTSAASESNRESRLQNTSFQEDEIATSLWNEPCHLNYSLQILDCI